MQCKSVTMIRLKQTPAALGMTMPLRHPISRLDVDRALTVIAEETSEVFEMGSAEQVKELTIRPPAFQNFSWTVSGTWNMLVWMLIDVLISVEIHACGEDGVLLSTETCDG